MSEKKRREKEKKKRREEEEATAATKAKGEESDQRPREKRDVNQINKINLKKGSPSPNGRIEPDPPRPPPGQSGIERSKKKAPNAERVVQKNSHGEGGGENGGLRKPRSRPAGPPPSVGLVDGGGPPPGPGGTPRGTLADCVGGRVFPPFGTRRSAKGVGLICS